MRKLQFLLILVFLILSAFMASPVEAYVEWEVGPTDGAYWRVDTGLLSHGTGAYGLLVPVPYICKDAKANVTAANTPIAGNPDTSSYTQHTYTFTAPRAGSIVSISVDSNAAATAGTLCFTVAINGVATSLQTGINVTDTQYNTATLAVGAVTFDAEDQITVQATSSSNFAPDGSADLGITIILAQ